ncbi:hypothetical protein [Microbacterium sp. YJN-G]|uniref:hypothetical protein n=1 Tax=Microbacterium sp. YJN-G TaxID=2763257 RepID=UPI0018781701|nr:hypothetical protein [Microbacterium sp. YJN-G]
MVAVTGNVATFGLTSVPMYGAEIVFIPSGPAVTGDRYVLSGRDVHVPIEGGTGAFTANLSPTETTRPGTFYRIRIVSLDSASNFTFIDFPEWELRVPTTGGPIADLLDLSGNPAMVWVGAEAPTPSPGMWWMTTDENSADYGWLMEWE